MKNNPLELLLNPRSIATVGAGNNPLKMGTIQALSIIMDGYKGNFYPLHPQEEQVFGYKAYVSPFDLPETPDLVMFVLPAPLVAPILEDFGKIGTRRAIVITAGFRETGADGQRLEEELKEVAARYGIRFLGPNCMGMINTALSLNVTVLPLEAKPGRLGMASQSGTYITQTLPYLKKRGINFSKAVSVGNEADLDITDVLEYLGGDEQTRAIALYIEGLKDANKFLEVASRITPKKPVVAQYVGGTEAGARAGQSHTGALAGPDYLYDGLFAQAGVIRVGSVEELYTTGQALAQAPPLQGERIAVLTNSGGPGTAISYTLNRGGLKVPSFSKALQEEIKKIIPAFASATNPVDLTFHMDTEVLAAKLPELIAKSGEADGFIFHGLMSSGFIGALYPHVNRLLKLSSKEEFLKMFSPDPSEHLEKAQELEMPILLSSFFGREDDYARAYQDGGIPVFDAPEKAARAMVGLFRYRQVKERGEHEKPEPGAPLPAAEEMILAALKKGERVLDEYHSKKLLSLYGIPVTPEKLVFSASEAVLAARELGGHVVLKGCAPEFAHKTGHGLICLDLKTPQEVEEAFGLIQQAAGAKIPILVAQMVKGAREFVAGITRRHPAFGPCVMFGLGGIFTEVLTDRVFRLAPLSLEEARFMLSSLKAAKILGPYRGLPAADLEALAALLQNLSFISCLHPQIAEIDLNPIIISGAKPVAVDALVILEGEEEEVAEEDQV